MNKYIAPAIGFALTAAFVIVFFAGRTTSRELIEVAPRVGMSHDQLLAMGPRIASGSGSTLGSARRVVYLLACSGTANRTAFEEQALRASLLAHRQRLTDREAVDAILAQGGDDTAKSTLKGC